MDEGGLSVKKYIPLLLGIMLLSACSDMQKANNGDVKTESQQTKIASNIEKNRAKSLSDIYVPNPQVSDDTNLLKVGQKIKDEKGEITLKGKASLNKTFTIGSVEMKIKNVKLIQNSPTYSLMDYFHYYTESYEKFQFVKVEVELVNKSDEKVNFGPVSHLKTSNNEVKAFHDDFFIEYLGGEIGPNASKQGALGFIVEKTTPSLDWVELTTSDVLDSNKKVVGKAQRIKINLEK